VPGPATGIDVDRKFVSTADGDAIDTLDAKEAQGISGDKVAHKVLEAVEDKKTAPLYSVGSHAPVVLLLQRLLPRTVIESVMAKIYRTDQSDRPIARRA
jgi:hypothetical protein